MRPTRIKTPKKKQKLEASIQDPIEVYCRIRPLDDGRIDNLCVRIKDDKTVVLFRPENIMSREEKEKHFSFKHVFDETTSQKELFNYVCLPLVQDLLEGKNGLLFTYGITSSGKTYTMTGTPQNGGLLPRSLDVIFNSIKDVQAKKFVFKPNNANGFEVQSVASAMAEQIKEIRDRRNKKEGSVGDWCSRTADTSAVEITSQDSNFAVFISYVEIYNNYVYDLLEDPSVKTQTSKAIREDTSKNMFVHMATVAEVKTVEEALELFYKGQIRRKVSNTALNSESSRSHSVFTIRVTQAPLDPLGAEVLQDKSKVTVSQLSLVDLAGSERQVKSKTADAILREAGKINTSLMTLRKCIEELRNRQMEGKVDKNLGVYRESKLTQLFKTFFEGQGKIRMVVCINPQAHYFEELNQVLIFADKAQDVLITRSTPLLTPKVCGLPGRRQFYGELSRKAKEQGVPVNDLLPPVVYTLGPDLPSFDRESYDESFYMDLAATLDARMMRKEAYVANFYHQCEEFRNNLVATEKERIRQQQEIVSQKMDLDHKEQRIRGFEHQLSSLQEGLDSLEKEKWEIKRQREELESEVSHCKRLVSDYEKQIDKMRKKMQEQATERERWRRHVEKWMAEKQADMERKLCHKDEIFRMFKDMLDKEYPDDQMMFEGLNMDIQIPSSATSSEISAPVTRTRVKSIVESMEPSAETRFSKTRSATDFTRSSKPNVQFSSQSSQNDVQSLFSKENRPPNSSAGTRNMAVANPRHRRSTSMGDKWIEHKPIGNLELNTILQPAMKKKKSVSKLEVKDVTNNDKYLLQHQEQDSKGEVETQLFKADIIPSAGGGAQIIFNDVEKLRQVSPPPSYNFRKRSGENLPLREVEDRCTLSVECHGLPSKIVRKK